MSSGGRARYLANLNETSNSPREQLTDHGKYFTYICYGKKYCRYYHAPPGKIKRVYESRELAQAAADRAFESFTLVLWEYQHDDHWHLTRLAPMILPIAFGGIRVGTLGKRWHHRHRLPYKKKKRRSPADNYVLTAGQEGDFFWPKESPRT